MAKPERVSDAIERARASSKDAIRIIAGLPSASSRGARPSPSIDAPSSAGTAQAERQAR